MRLLAVLALLAAAPALAQDVPALVPHQGRLVDASAPVDGTFSTRFALYRAETGGTPAWSETRSVTFDNGYYGVNLGEAVPIPASLFDGEDLWLGVRVGSAAELPRIRVASTPYAARAGVASNVDGDITPNSISINGTTVINAAGQWVGATEGLQGPPGEDADPAEVATALSASSGFVSTVATNLATSHAAALRGPQGVQGPQGPQGPQGNPGSPDSGAEILSKLAQVDGSGSGLDADLLDGLSSAALIDAAADEVLVNLPPIGGIEGADQTVAILVRATGSGTVGATRSIQIAGAEAITFNNANGLAMVVVDRETYDIVSTVNGIPVTRNFDVDNASTGLVQWATFIDAISQLRFADHLVVLASKGPINRYLYTSINGGPTPAELLDGFGADVDGLDLDGTDAFALIGYPDVGRGNGLAMATDTSVGSHPAADLAGIVMDGILAGVNTTDFGDLSLGTRNDPGRTCKSILQRNPNARDGVYWIDPDGDGTPTEVLCDMSRVGGGWTLGLKIFYSSQVIGQSGAHGSVEDASQWSNTGYKLADATINSVIGANWDVLIDQVGHNSSYSRSNQEFITIENYTAAWTFTSTVPESSTTTRMRSYRAYDEAIAWEGRLGCGPTSGSPAGPGINCREPLSGPNPAGGAGCTINMGLSTSTSWHDIHMARSNHDTYVYICSGAQHSSSHNMNHRVWFRER